MSTHPYWVAPAVFRPQKSVKPIAHDLGFQWTMQWPLPVTMGSYFGSNPEWGRRQDVYRSDPEFFAVDNIIPSTAGIPLMNPYTAEMRFDREKFTKRH